MRELQIARCVSDQESAKLSGLDQVSHASDKREEAEVDVSTGKIRDEHSGAFVWHVYGVHGQLRKHSPEEKKRTALWMKKHKVELRRLVLALILVESNPAKRLGFKAFAVVFSKFWGYPLLLAPSREQAIEMARELLSMDAKSSY